MNRIQTMTLLGLTCALGAASLPAAQSQQNGALDSARRAVKRLTPYLIVRLEGNPQFDVKSGATIYVTATLKASDYFNNQTLTPTIYVNGQPVVKPAPRKTNKFGVASFILTLPPVNPSDKVYLAIKYGGSNTLYPCGSQNRLFVSK